MCLHVSVGTRQGVPVEAISETGGIQASGRAFVQDLWLGAAMVRAFVVQASHVIDESSWHGLHCKVAMDLWQSPSGPHATGKT